MPSDSYIDSALPRVLLIGAPHDRAMMARIVTSAGGSVAESVDWPRAADRSEVRFVVAAAGDLAGDDLAHAVEMLRLAADEGDVAIIVTLRAHQIDAVAGTLMGGKVQLLCDADDSELAGAIALAFARRELVSDTVREGEEERLRRLNDEVARIAKLLAELSENERRSGGVADRATGFGMPPVSSSATAPVRAIDIRNVIRARRLRDQHFARGLFEDPAWDMLLDLYAAELEGARVSVSSLCIAAAVAPTTALRWINRMTEAKLFDRRPDPFDRRRVFLGLNADARSKMDRYFAAVAAAGLLRG